VLPEHCPPFTVHHGKLVLSHSYNLGSTATVLCEPDYFWTGSLERVCQLNMQWSGNAGDCCKLLIS